MTIKIASIPIVIHWSVIIGPIALAVVAKFHPAATFVLVVVYLLVLALHESGHAIAARTRGLTVFSIHVSGFGGECCHEMPASYGAAAITASGGLVAQAIVLLITIATLSLVGIPASSLSSYIGTALLYVNAAILIGNLIPWRRRIDGGVTDGYLLWVLARNRIRGRPYSSSTASARFFARPVEDFVTGIEILSDDTTPKEFVVNALMTHLHVTEQDATWATSEIHDHGHVLIAIQPAERANAIAQAIAADAIACGHPLICRAIETH